MDEAMPATERAASVRPVTLSIECPACGAEHDIDALTGLEERRDGSFMATECACTACDCGVLIEIPDIIVEFKK